MIISNSGRFIFVHITKCAGTSLSRLLEPNLRWNDVVLGGTDFGARVQDPYRQRFGLHQHSYAREIRAVVGEEVWEDYFTFTFVRHPYARLVSLYTFVRRLVGGRKGRLLRPLPGRRGRDYWSWPVTRAFLRSRDYSAFIRDPLVVNESLGARPQAEWVLDGEGKRLIVDFAGKTENMEEDLRAVAERLRLPSTAPGVHNASNASGDMRGFYRSEEDYRYMHERYRKDFELFGYDPDVRY